MNLLSKFGKLFKPASKPVAAPAAMLPWDCCGTPRQHGGFIDMGHAHSFDMDLTSCATCGAQWAHLFCVANGRTGWERLADEDAKALVAAPDGPQRKKLLREWIDRSL